MSYGDTLLFVNNIWRESKDGKSLPVVNPANGQEIGRVAHACLEDLDEAIAAAQNGFEIWKNMTPSERGKLMRKAATLIRERSHDIATCMTMEQGKPLRESTAEVSAAAEIIEWFSEEGMRIYGRLVPARSSVTLRQMVVRDPIGPVAAFTPWNFPINQLVRKLGAGLAAGCSMIVKAPEETPASPAALIKAFADAGLPPGVLGLVFGNPVQISDYLIRHPVIRKITFTGSTPVGKQLASLAGQYMKRVTMELGGHAPVIVCEDADVERAVKTSVMGKYRNAGQICICPTRFLVHRSIAKEFSAEFVRQTEQLIVGDGLHEGSQMGPLANERRVKAMAELTSDAVSRGATLLSGGSRIGSNGNFWSPTVLTDVPLNARVFNEEPFGPIAPIRSYDTLDEALIEANRLSYGLAGYAYTRSLKTADILSRKLEAGMLWINTSAVTSAEIPFGGIKDSGYGTEGGPEALEAYLNVRSVAVQND
ncbi:NAD-dependent succinate-semialdehyde dehydrogenase [Rhodoferax ferrireducens]|uniref:NAD-dependent succinate-semialdehyde dehydrogenase n=1 Tax=Rhodoferax ferrireducens TaxID=192843 RepID=UPI000E0D2451|nr:NAD-dependent succinate-semialdehyde dehydrogenase [Rhodoferax ferrireducens]